VETRCNSPVPGRNRTRNRTAHLDPFLTLTSTHGVEEAMRFVFRLGSGSGFVRFL
jgi:hypothetical protein